MNTIFNIRDLLFRPTVCRTLSMMLSLMFAMLTFAAVDTAVGQQPDADASFAKHFPASTIAFVEVTQPAELIGKIQNHPVVDQVAELKPVKGFLRSPQFALAMLGKGLIETQINQSLEDAAKVNLAGGLAIGLDPATDGVVILFKSDDEAKLRRLVGTLLKFIASDAEGKGKPEPFQKNKYRDAVVAKFDDFIIGRYQSWFIIANKSELARQIADNLMDGAPQSLADEKWFQQARDANSDADISVVLDLKTIREAGLMPKLFRGRTDNPAAELIVGGLLDAFKRAPWFSQEIHVDQQIDVTWNLPFDAVWASPARRYFFGDDLKGAAPHRLQPKNVLANLTSHRDLSDWWLSKEELYDEATIAKLAQADSQLATVFSGMDFGEDVLGSLEPGVQIVVTEKQFGQKDRPDIRLPDIRLPAFAMVGKMKDPAKIARKLKVVFQSTIGFVNLGLGMEGQPQLDLETEMIGTAKLSSTQYVVDENSEPGLMLYNFSPTMATQGDWFILSSDRELAIELCELAGQQTKVGSNVASKVNFVGGATGSDSPSNSHLNTRLTIDGVVLSRILTDNREGLIAQNMLEKGHGRKAAEIEIEMLLFVAGLFRDSQLDFEVGAETLKLHVQTRFNER